MMIDTQTQFSPDFSAFKRSTEVYTAMQKINRRNRGMPYHAMHASNLDLPPPIRHPHTIWARLDAARAAPRGRAPRAAAHQLRLGSISGDPQAAAAPPLAVRPADQVTMNLSTGSKRCNRTFMALLKFHGVNWIPNLIWSTVHWHYCPYLYHTALFKSLYNYAVVRSQTRLILNLT